jgi:hypothetical protein
MRREAHQNIQSESKLKSAVAVIEVVLFAIAFTAIFTVIVQAQSGL